MMPTLVRLPHVLVAALLVATALIAMYRKRESLPRLVIGVVVSVTFLFVTWQWVENFRQCRVIGGSFSYCATR